MSSSQVRNRLILNHTDRKRGIATHQALKEMGSTLVVADHQYLCHDVALKSGKGWLCCAVLRCTFLP